MRFHGSGFRALGLGLEGFGFVFGFKVQVVGGGCTAVASQKTVCCPTH